MKTYRVQFKKVLMGYVHASNIEEAQSLAEKLFGTVFGAADLWVQELKA